MSTSSLTIRLPNEQREALKRSARMLKKSESEYIRDLLQRDLDTRLIGERMGDLVGCLDSSQTIGKPHPLKEQIRSSNCRK
jgi:Arc/MetJ-type ribon-helix-helix transcriptional regulator